MTMIVDFYQHFSSIKKFMLSIGFLGKMFKYLIFLLWLIMTNNSSARYYKKQRKAKEKSLQKYQDTYKKTNRLEEWIYQISKW